MLDALPYKDAELYPWQYQALLRAQSPEAKRWTAWFCGTGAGKSYAGAAWLLAQQIAAAKRLAADPTSQDKYPRTLAVAPTLSSLRRYVIGSLEEITKGTIYQGDYKENRHEYHWPSAAGGGTTICGSFDNKESVKRMEGGQYDAAWCDEAGMTPDQAYAVLRARTAIRQAPILLTSYWYAPINWCYSKIWKQWEAGDPDVDVLNLPSTVNPDYPREEIEAARRTLDKALFEMRYLGKPTRMVGLVYGDAWDSASPILHCKPFDIPTDKDEKGRYKWHVFTGGVDQGYSPAPFRVVMGVEDPDSGVDYQFCEYHSLATTTHEKAIGIVKMLLKYVPDPTARHYDLYADPSNKQGIADLRYELGKIAPKVDRVPRLDIRVYPADNAVESGIEYLTAALKTGTFRVMRGRCPHLVEEFGLYCRDSNGAIVKANDHSVDPARYKVYSRKRLRPVGVPLTDKSRFGAGVFHRQPSVPVATIVSDEEVRERGEVSVYDY